MPLNVELLDQLLMQSFELLQIGVVTKHRQTTVRKERVKKKWGKKIGVELTFLR